MAITATFVANFDAFNDAVKIAAVTLKDFGTGTDSVGQRLDKMSNAFTGRKIVQEATVMAEAIQRVGGVTALTDAELQRAAATAAQAAEKLAAIGEKVPPKIADLASHLRQTNTVLQDMRSVALSAAEGLAAMFTLRALAQFVQDTVTAARQLRNLSLQTRISTDELQVMGAAAVEVGVDSEQMGRAIFQLSRRIAGDDTSAAAALHMMGMSLQDVKDLNGEELFTKILRGLNSVQGSLRDTAAADLFGARLGASMIALSSRLDETMAKVRQSDTLMSHDAVAAAAAYADALDRLSRSAHAFAANELTGVISGLDTLLETATKGGKMATFKAWVLDLAGASGVLPTYTHHLADLVDQLGRMPKDIELPKVKAPNAAAGGGPSPDEIFAAIQLDALKPLTATQEKYLTQLFDIGRLTTGNAESYGVNAEQLENFRKKEEEIIQVQERMSEAVKKTHDELNQGIELYARISNAGVKATDELNKATEKWLESTTAAIQGLRDLNKQAETSLANRNAPPKSPINAALDTRDSALSSLAAQESAFKSSAAGQANTEDLFSARRAKIWADFDDAVMKAGTTATTLSAAHAGAVQAGETLSAGLTSSAAALEQFRGQLVGGAGGAAPTGGSAVEQRLRLLASAQASGQFINPAGLFAGLGARASGGPVSGGQPYLVGERGPELFTPQTSGDIAANGSPSAIHVTVNGVIAADRAELIAFIKRGVRDALTSSRRV